MEVHGIPGRLFGDYLSTEKESGCRVIIAVLEVWSAELLMFPLVGLPRLACMCRGCKAGSFCSAPGGIKEGIFWPRPHMRTVHRFEDREILEIRNAWNAVATA